MFFRRFSVVIADRSTGAVRRLTIRAWIVGAAIACALALPIVIGLGARWSAQAEIYELRAGNENLTLENESYRAATAQRWGLVDAIG